MIVAPMAGTGWLSRNDERKSERKLRIAPIIFIRNLRRLKVPTSLLPGCVLLRSRLFPEAYTPSFRFVQPPKPRYGLANPRA